MRLLCSSKHLSLFDKKKIDSFLLMGTFSRLTKAGFTKTAGRRRKAMHSDEGHLFPSGVLIAARLQSQI